MKCQVESSQTQRMGISPGEMQEVQGWEAHHSGQFLQAEAQKPPGTPRTFGNKIKWLVAMDKKAWFDFNVDISKILEITSKGSVDKWIIMNNPYVKEMLMSSQIIKIESVMHLTGCWQQPIKWMDEWSMIIQMNK